MTSSNPEKLFALLPEAEKEAAKNSTMALYQLSKQSGAFRMGYRFVVAPKALENDYKKSGIKIIKRHKAPNIELPNV